MSSRDSIDKGILAPKFFAFFKLMSWSSDSEFEFEFVTQETAPSSSDPPPKKKVRRCYRNPNPPENVVKRPPRRSLRLLKKALRGAPEWYGPPDLGIYEWLRDQARPSRSSDSTSTPSVGSRLDLFSVSSDSIFLESLAESSYTPVPVPPVPDDIPSLVVIPDEYVPQYPLPEIKIKIKEEQLN